ncbi:MAG: hypothetical protein DDT28_00054 [Dehalococcoidia bacterium]|nr:hypothetical protein [Chloroflexota bacterium]
MNCHLITIKVGVEGSTHQRMQLDSTVIDKDRLESLDAEAMQGRSSIQQDRMVPHYFLQYIPDDRVSLLHRTFGVPNIIGQTSGYQAPHDEGFKQLQRHPLGQPTLVQLKLGARHNNRATTIVNPLPEQILAKVSLLTPQHV